MAAAVESNVSEANHTVVIPAAGYSGRFLDIGKRYQKGLLPYRGRPVLVHLIRKVRADLPGAKVTVAARNSDFQSRAQRPFWNLTFGEMLRDRGGLSIVQDDAPVQGPVTSILSAAQFAPPGRITVVLSDMVLHDDFPLHHALVGDQLFVYDGVPSPIGRWCFFRHDDQKFFDKPDRSHKGARPLLGVYSLSNGGLFVSCLRSAEKKHGSDAQISHALELYRDLYDKKFTPVPCPILSVEDTGTLDEYVSSRRNTAPRSGTKIEYGRQAVTKRGDADKLKSEEDWLKVPPPPYHEHAALVVASGPGWYSTARIHEDSLRTALLYKDRSPETWLTIMGMYADLLKRCKKLHSATGRDYWDDVMDRVANRCGRSVPQEFYVELGAALDRVPGNSPFHGDPHFANTFRVTSKYGTDKLVTIDPRGEKRGHWLYDAAKVCHSAVGRYDYADSGLYANGPDGPLYYDDDHDRGPADAFRAVVLDGMTSDEREAVRLLTAALFASMQPLHDQSVRGVLQSEFEFFYRNKDALYLKRACGEVSVGSWL